MDFSLSQILILGIATFALVGGLTPVMRKIALKVGAVDRPNLERKTQKEPVPYLGGVAISIGITVASFAALLYSDFSTETFSKALSVLLSLRRPARPRAVAKISCSNNRWHCGSNLLDSK